MKHLSDHDLLAIWEVGLNQSLLEWGLYLLTCAYPEYDFRAAASLSIGERDARLLKIRELLFGSRLQNVANCPDCEVKVEWEMPLSAITIQSISESEDAKTLILPFAEYQIHLRPPNSLDLFEILPLEDPDTRFREILKKCIVQSSPTINWENEMPKDLPDAVLRKIEENDPQADIILELECPECRNSWRLPFDILSYLWAEINAWANKMIRDVCELASQFGWSEKDILNMSSFRRRMYLDMIPV